MLLAALRSRAGPRLIGLGVTGSPVLALRGQSMKQQEPGVRTLCSGRAGLRCDVRALSASSLGASEVHPSCKPTLSPLHTVPNPGSALLGYLVLLRAEIGCACTHRAIASMRPRFRPPVFAHLPDFSCWRVSCLRHRVCDLLGGSSFFTQPVDLCGLHTGPPPAHLILASVSALSFRFVQNTRLSGTLSGLLPQGHGQ